MLAITLQRDKCIGCNYCFEIAPELFRMSKKDGKSVLLNSEDKRGFHTIRVSHEMDEKAQRCKEVCPINIIKVHACKG
jgi:ferredoxin